MAYRVHPLVHWFIATLAVLVSAYIIPGVTVTSVFAAFVAALVLGFINMFIRPIIIVLTLPLNIMTLGLLTLVINALLVQLAGSLVPGFEVAGFLPALFFSIVLWVVNGLLRTGLGEHRV
ncbi:phage holin family protein [Candidatus Uhrbacteria bacterium]|nr:phage holin family protein [Candidatus Uhrbacteria bacterium]